MPTRAQAESLGKAEPGKRPSKLNSNGSQTPEVFETPGVSPLNTSTPDNASRCFLLSAHYSTLNADSIAMNLLNVDESDEPERRSRSRSGSFCGITLRPMGARFERPSYFSQGKRAVFRRLCSP